MEMQGWMNYEREYVHLTERSYIYIKKLISTYFESLRGIYYHRTLNDYIKSKPTDWDGGYITFLSEMSLDLSVLTWVKLFGNKKSQHIQYSKLFTYPDLSKHLNTLGLNSSIELLNNMLTTIEKTETEFELYKKAILKYRNQFVAHMDLHLHIYSDDNEETRKAKAEQQLKAYPTLDIAEKTLDWLYLLIVKLLDLAKSVENGYVFTIFETKTIKNNILAECDLMKNSFLKL